MVDEPPSDDGLKVGAPDPGGIDARVLLGELREQMFGAREPAKVGRFELLRLLGRGAFGSVYLARDEELEREVAVKLLTTGGGDPQMRARFVREAQALAKLKHPNVLTIYDVGVEDDRVYIAMEYVESGTLSRWCAEHRPGTRARFFDVLRLAVAAGWGLAAAHEAGIVHRDVKPANILVGADGRPRLADFGLARSGSGLHATWDVDTQSESSASTTLTNTGDVLGTPAYMAPEQFAGSGDVASDQWSLCATFWEAAYGERPFRGKDRTELAQAVQGRPRSPPSERSEVPTWWREILTRGLSPEPADRWPSVGALVAALDTAAARRRRKVTIASVGSVALVGLGVLGWQRFDLEQRRAQCEREAEGITEVWNDSTKQTLHESLLQTEVSYAESTFARAAPTVDAYAGHWREQYEASCVASEVDRRRDPDMWAASARCFRERKAQLASLLEVLTDDPDADAASRTVSAVASLPRIEACSDDARLLRAHTTAEDPADEEMRRRLRRAEALDAAGSYEAGRTLAEALVEETEGYSSPRLRAEILLAQGQLEDGAGDPKTARDVLSEAFDVALAAGEDDVAFEAANMLVYVVGDELTDRDQGLLWGRVAEGLQARFAGPRDLTAANLAGNRGHAHLEHGEYDEASEHYARALAIRSDVLGPDHPEVARMFSGIGNVRRAQGKHDEAEEAQLRALEILQRALGEDHPGVALAHNNLGNVYQSQGRYEDATRSHEAAIEIRKDAQHGDHPDIAGSYVNLAHAQYAQGEYDEAERSAKRALAIIERALGPEHANTAVANEKLGMIYHRKGQYAEAEKAFAKALAVREAELGADHPAVGRTLSSMSITYFFLERYEDAERSLLRAIEILEAKRGPEHADVANALNTLGNVYKQWKRYEDAEKAFARALAILEKALGPDHPNLAVAQTNLASLAARDGRHDEAERAYSKAIELRERKLGKDHPALLMSLRGRSIERVALGRATEAVRDAERALAIAEKSGGDPIGLADAQRGLANALRAAGTDPGRARQLATGALEAYRSGGERYAEDVAETERWLAESN